MVLLSKTFLLCLETLHRCLYRLKQRCFVSFATLVPTLENIGDLSACENVLLSKDNIYDLLTRGSCHSGGHYELKDDLDRGHQELSIEPELLLAKVKKLLVEQEALEGIF